MFENKLALFYAQDKDFYIKTFTYVYSILISSFKIK